MSSKREIGEIRARRPSNSTTIPSPSPRTKQIKEKYKNKSNSMRSFNSTRRYNRKLALNARVQSRKRKEPIRKKQREKRIKRYFEKRKSNLKLNNKQATEYAKHLMDKDKLLKIINSYFYNDEPLTIEEIEHLPATLILNDIAMLNDKNLNEEEIEKILDKYISPVKGGRKKTKKRQTKKRQTKKRQTKKKTN